MASGRSDRNLSQALGTVVPSARERVNDLWLLVPHRLSDDGVEFREFQTWARAVASMNASAEEQSLMKPLTGPSSRQDAPESGAWEVSKILGTTMPTRENWLDSYWLEALFSLSSRGVLFSALQSWSRNVMMRNSFTSDMDTLSSENRGGLVEILPSLLMNTQALRFKSPELRMYVAGLDRSRFYEKEYLENVKAHLKEHKLLYWNRRDVSIVVQARVGSATATGVPQLVRELYDSIPTAHRCTCEVVEAGSNCKPWVMRCGDVTGSYGTKKAARMIAIIRKKIDPCFDPHGDSPPPSIYVKRKREEFIDMVQKRFRKNEETTNSK